jgi:hypothetical protein
MWVMNQGRRGGWASGTYGEKGNCGASGIYGEKGNAHGVLTQKAEVTTTSGRPIHTYGTIILKYTSMNEHRRTWTWLICLRQGEVAAFCEHGNETSNLNRM